jgi:hypothetical protein
MQICLTQKRKGLQSSHPFLLTFVTRQKRGVDDRRRKETGEVMEDEEGQKDNFVPYHETCNFTLT